MSSSEWSFDASIRLAVLPQGDAETVLSTIESGIDADPEIDPPDRAVRVIGISTGPYLWPSQPLPTAR